MTMRSTTRSLLLWMQPMMRKIALNNRIDTCVAVTFSYFREMSVFVCVEVFTKYLKITSVCVLSSFYVKQNKLDQLIHFILEISAFVFPFFVLRQKQNNQISQKTAQTELGKNSRVTWGHCKILIPYRTSYFITDYISLPQKAFLTFF